MDKQPLQSKKFWALLLGLLACVGLIAGGMAIKADVWVLRILAVGLVVLGTGYVLGVAALERVLLRAGAIYRPEVDDHLDVPILPPAEPPPGVKL